MLTRMEFTLGEDGKSFEISVLDLVRRYEKPYFPDTQPIDAGEFVDSLDGPSCFVPTMNAIYLRQCFSPFLKLCSILVLHELIHSKLYKNNGDPDEKHGPRFKAEVKRLMDAGVYAKLL